MGMTWTEEQSKIIAHRKGNLLVSAAAGSGKTAVLVEHVISRITDPEQPISLSSLLIMTFTEAAAQEMRDRIQAALEAKLQMEPDNVGLIREVGNIQNARISTIDSFCKRLISENYVLLENIDPAFRIGDSGELELLQSDIIEEMLEEYYLEGSEDFLEFMDQFSRGKGDDGIEELILKLYTYAEATPWPEDYLAGLELGREKEAEELLLQIFRSRFQDYIEELSYGIELCEEEDGPEEYLPMLEQDQGAIRAALAAASLRELMERVRSISFATLKRTKSEKKQPVKDIRDRIKKKLQELPKKLILPPEEKTEELERGLSRSVGTLISLTLDFMRRFREEKDKRRMLDFSDLEHLALQLLYRKNAEGERVPSQVADDYAEQLEEILVDEYQDSNEVQECLIRALSGERFGRPNVFQVGDVKQSIYSFRQARPDLFLSKYQDKDYPSIELAKNFRSRESVLYATNQVFYRIMRKEIGGIDYTEEVSLHLGRTAEENPERDYRTELQLCDYGTLRPDSGEEIEVDKVEAETRLIAHRIRKLREEGYRYRDMVILMRSPGGWADSMVEVLGNEGIPAYSISDEGYFSTVEVETVLALLSIIDNPRQGIPLAAVMHSPIYGFTDEELALIKAIKGSLERVFPEEELLRNGKEEREDAIEQPSESEVAEEASEETAAEEAAAEPASLLPELEEKLQRFYRSIWQFREKSRYLSIHELLYYIYEETAYYEYVSAMPGGRKRRANLDQLIDSALQFEASSYRGLFDYIRYIEKLKKYNSDQGEASVYSDQEDLVRIISIHRSKGLQFPVVFLSGLGKKFNKMDLTGKILMEPELGIAADYVDRGEKVRYPSISRMAIREKLEAMQLGEELRILYVGMTRAEDKLIMTAALSDVEKALGKLGDRDRALSSSQIQSAGSFLDLIFMAEGQRLFSVGEEAPIRLCTHSLQELFELGTEKLSEDLDLMAELRREIQHYDREEEGYREAMERFSFAYPFEEATKLYPKHSVSEIKKQQYQGLGPGSAQPEESAEDSFRVLSVTESYSEESPAENTEKVDRTEIGNAYHHALQAFDYERGLEQLPEILPERELDMIQPEKLENFLKSELGQRFRKAQKEGRLFREKSFMKEVPYSYLFKESKISEQVLLQGVIDAFILEEDGILLVDYKTDRVRSEKTLLDRYQIQLELYGDALEKISGRRVKQKSIYSFALDREIPLP